MKKLCETPMDSYYWLLKLYSYGRIDYERLLKGLEGINKYLGRITTLILLLVVLCLPEAHANTVNHITVDTYYLACAIANANHINACHTDLWDSKIAQYSQIIDAEKNNPDNFSFTNWQFVSFLGTSKFGSDYTGPVWEKEVLHWLTVMYTGKG
jgi:hypothetical protein